MSVKIEMADIVCALEKVRGAPVLTSNQCLDLAQALNAAAPVIEHQDGSALMKIAADLANRHPLRQLYLVCEHQGRINTDSLHEHLDKCGDLLAGIALDIRRAITSQTAPAELTVWEGAMPESNGKSNFTVILHTGDITEGICVYRSEYPDRARYKADCFRHLIGDPAFPEKPFVCDYDADKHSGYVKPDTSPPAPVALTESFVQPVPDKCDRITWRGSYYHLPLETPAPVAVVLPEHAIESTFENRGDLFAIGWNACLDKVKELNQ